MKDGLPIYASPLYQGDTEISKVRADRDPRLHVLLKEPGQQNSLVNVAEGDHVTAIETVPNIMATDADHGYSTGYALRKGNSYDGNQCDNGQGSTACPVSAAWKLFSTTSRQAMRKTVRSTELPLNTGQESANVTPALTPTS